MKAKAYDHIVTVHYYTMTAPIELIASGTVLCRLTPKFLVTDAASFVSTFVSTRRRRTPPRYGAEQTFYRSTGKRYGGYAYGWRLDLKTLKPFKEAT